MTTTKGPSPKRASTVKRIAGGAAALAAIGSLTVWAVSKSRAQAQSQASVQANPAVHATTGSNSNTNTGNSAVQAPTFVTKFEGNGARLVTSGPTQAATVPTSAPLTEKEVELEAFRYLNQAIREYPSRYGGVELGTTHKGCTHRYKALQEEAETALQSIRALGVAAKKEKVAMGFLATVMSGGMRFSDRCDHTMAFEK